MNDFEAFFSDIPALICTDNTCVAAVNKVGEVLRIAVGEHLCAGMLPLDVLRFQAALESRRKPDSDAIVTFELINFHGYSTAAAVFQRITSCRFAIVWLFHSDGEAKLFLERHEKELLGKSQRRVADFISKLADIPDEQLDDGERCGLLDFGMAARRCIEDIKNRCSAFDCMVDISENEEMAAVGCHPINVSVGCLLQMTAAMLLCMNDISQSRFIGVRLCCYGDQCELRMSADSPSFAPNAYSLEGLASVLPTASIYLSLCDFVAGMCGCTLSCLHSPDAETVTLTLTFAEDSLLYVDFKSRDQFIAYSDSLDFVMGAVEKERLSRRKAEAPTEE